MLNLPKGNKKGGAEASNPLLEAANFYWGVLPVLLASLTSGICAALTQKTLQVRFDEIRYDGRTDGRWCGSHGCAINGLMVPIAAARSPPL